METSGTFRWEFALAKRQVHWLTWLRSIFLIRFIRTDMPEYWIKNCYAPSFYRWNRKPRFLLGIDELFIFCDEILNLLRIKLRDRSLSFYIPFDVFFGLIVPAIFLRRLELGMLNLSNYFQDSRHVIIMLWIIINHVCFDYVSKSNQLYSLFWYWP